MSKRGHNTPNRFLYQFTCVGGVCGCVCVCVVAIIILFQLTHKKWI